MPVEIPQFPPLAPTDEPVEVTTQRIGNVAMPEDRHTTRRVERNALLMDGDFLKVTNRDRKTVTFRWARKVYPIEPGTAMFVPFEACVEELGDPRSLDGERQKFNDGQGTQGIIMERYDELRRGFAKYGIANERIEGVTLSNGEYQTGLVDVTPRVEVETLQGVRIQFPFLKPDMTALPIINIDAKRVDSDSLRMNQELQAENDELRERQDRLEETVQALLAQREAAE